MCGDMVDTLLTIIRLTYVDCPQKMVAEIDVEQSSAFSVWADCYVLSCQAFCNAEIAFLETKSTVISLG